MRSADGTKECSIVASGAQLFRFVEETYTYEPPVDGLDGYYTWYETNRSGLYGSEDEPVQAAFLELSWLRQD